MHNYPLTLIFLVIPKDAHLRRFSGFPKNPEKRTFALPPSLRPIPPSYHHPSRLVIFGKNLMESEAQKEIWSFTIQKLKVFDKIHTCE